MYIDGKRRVELKNEFKLIKEKLTQFKNKELKLIKFEVFVKSEWKDYSIVHPKINETKVFLGISNEKIVLKDIKGELIKLDITSKVYDLIELKEKQLIITYDDKMRLRWYRGKGVRLTYLFI